MRSTTQGAGNIINDNSLVLYLDVANQNSYPGSGTVWYDLTPNKNHFNLAAPPTYTGNSFMFNGTTQGATCINTTCGNFNTGSFTVEYIVNYQYKAGVSDYCTIYKRDSILAPASQSLPGWEDRVGANVFFVQDNNPGAGTNDFTRVINFTSPPTGSIYQVTYTIEKNGTSTTGSKYLNGVLTGTDRKVFAGSNSVDNSSPIRIMGPVGATPGSMSTVRLYNRNLTAAEVFQNYEALKPRFFGVP